jgi:hypothetical protein
MGWDLVKTVRCRDARSFFKGRAYEYGIIPLVLALNGETRLIPIKQAIDLQIPLAGPMVVDDARPVGYANFFWISSAADDYMSNYNLHHISKSSR